jgi:hypothetical protein
VGRRIDNQIGEHLAVKSGIAVHSKVGLAIDPKSKIVTSQAGSKASDNLFGHLAEIKAPPIRKIALGSHLLLFTRWIWYNRS